jgi:hypothetical protein
MNTKKAIILSVFLLAIGTLGAFAFGNIDKMRSNSSDFPPRQDPEQKPAKDIKTVKSSVPLLNIDGDPSKYTKLEFRNNTLDMSDWETYKNEEFGFELRYPRDWRVKYRAGVCSSAGYGVGYVIIHPKSDPLSDTGAIICVDSKTFNLAILLSAGGWEEKRKIIVNNVAGIERDKKDKNGVWLNSELYELNYGKMLYSFTDMGKTHTAVFQKILLSFTRTK